MRRRVSRRRIRAPTAATASRDRSQSSSNSAPRSDNVASARRTSRPPERSAASTASTDPAGSATSTSSRVIPSPAPVSSLIGPQATSRPAFMATTWSQTRSTSSSWCDDSTTLIEKSRLIWPMRVSISLRCTGSRPSVGSSSSTSFGSEAMAWASFTRWRWPVDIVPRVRRRSSPSPTSHRVSEARLRASLRGRPCTSARCRTKSTARISSGSTLRSDANPTMARSRWPAFCGSKPRTVSDPDVGTRNPSMALSSVVLPAPLAPTSPVTPGCISTSRPSRATVGPKRCVSACVSMIVTRGAYARADPLPMGCRGRSGA